MSGLFVKNNLREALLNKTEAIQKLYAPGINSDIQLFSFSNSILSDLKPNFLVNRPFSSLSGDIINRTKFITFEETSDTTRYTFSNENKVWIDSVDDSLELDKRTEIESTDGSKVVFSKRGSISDINILGVGSQYEIRDSNNVIVPGLNEVLVRVKGSQSGSDNAIIKLFLDSDIGSLDRDQPIEVVNAGSGYIDNEILFLLPQCKTGESPSTSKCFNYTGNSNKLYQRYFSPAAFEAYLKSKPYIYTVKDSDKEGFFLFNERDQKWVYLGSQYDIELDISDQVTLKRSDSLKVDNFLSLEKLDGNSRIFDYFNNPGDKYSLPKNLSETIDELFTNVESISEDLSVLYQDVKKQLSQNDPNNRLGTSINIYEGANLSTSFRMIFRDPDGVLDNPDVTFELLRDLVDPDSIELDISGELVKIPGIWINVGGVYKRAYSVDDKPFQNTKDKKYLSPMIDRLATGQTNYNTGTYVTRNNTGENKYSLAAYYLKPNGETVLGFDTEISSLMQSLSTIAQPQNGGITYRVPLTSITIGNRPAQNVKGWPLFKASNTTNQYFILAV